MKIVSETIIFLMKMFANMAGSVIVATTLTCCVLGIFFAKPEKSNKLLSVCWGCKSLPFAQIGVRGGVCVSLWQNIATMTELGSSSIAIIKWHVSVVKNKRSSGSAG